VSGPGDSEALQQLAAAAEARAADRAFLQHSLAPGRASSQAGAGHTHAQAAMEDSGTGYAHKHRSSLLASATGASPDRMSPAPSRQRSAAPAGEAGRIGTAPLSIGTARPRSPAGIDADVEARIEVLLGSRPADLSRHSAGALLASRWAEREGYGDRSSGARMVMPVSPAHSAAASPRHSAAVSPRHSARGLRGEPAGLIDGTGAPGPAESPRNRTPTPGSPQTRSGGRRPSSASELPAKLSSASPRRLHHEAGWAAEQYRRRSGAGSVGHLMTDSGHESGSERSAAAPVRQDAPAANQRQSTSRPGNRRVRNKRQSGGLASQPRAGWASSLRD
jgi:hypothetical protein